MAGEFDYIRWVRERAGGGPGVLVGPGDDCAVLASPAGPLLVTTDLLTEGVDFLLAECGPRAAGRKAMGVNLSDIAAMAGVPAAAVVAVALPPGGREVAEELFHGLKEVADGYGCPVVGGDTNVWAGGLVVTVTVLGRATDRGPVLRGGAKPGDWLFVTGPLGGSLLGRHLAPTPRVREALTLHQLVDLHAMIDISDGLAKDLGHLCEESRCGARLERAAIPVHPDAVERAGRTGRTPLEHALGDGEDFELLFAASPADGARLAEGSPVPVWKVGECVESGLWLDDDALPPAGWEHELAGPAAGPPPAGAGG